MNSQSRLPDSRSALHAELGFVASSHWLQNEILKLQTFEITKRSNRLDKPDRGHLVNQKSSDDKLLMEKLYAPFEVKFRLNTLATHLCELLDKQRDWK